MKKNDKNITNLGGQPLEVFAYLRVSGKGQLDQSGFDRQLASVNTFCSKQGYKVQQVFKEQVSGTAGEEDRQEFTMMVSAILKNGVNTIVVESLDRLAREYRIQEQLVIYLASKGINLIAANTGENITEAINADPMRKAMVQIQGVFAELDKSLLVRKLRKARELKRAEVGKCEGRKGYKDTEQGIAILKEIRRLRRRRKGRKGKTFDQVASELNQQGYLATNGKPFTGNTVKGILHRQKKMKR